ncbi:MAG: NUDIX domain-containing protein [Nanoarchaeota archaeon]
MWEGSDAVILNDYGHVLLELRSDVHLWALPGGGRAGKETPEQTAVRETFEETGLKVKPIRYVGSYKISYFHYKRLSYVFVCKMTGGKLATNRESTKIRFFHPQKLPKRLFYIHKQRLIDALAGKENAMKVQRLSAWRILANTGFNPALSARVVLFSLRVLAEPLQAKSTSP